MFDFIAIDFETANSKMSSACSIGIAAVENGKVVETYYSLLNPYNQSFNSRNVAINGITSGMVKDSPTLDELIPELSQYFDEHIPVVAHNAHFDMSVLKASSSVELPNFIYVDSIGIASNMISGGKSLEYCANALSIEINNHHNAADDATVCAEIVLKGLCSKNCATLWEYIAKTPYLTVHYFDDLKAQRYMPTSHNSAKTAYYAKWAKAGEEAKVEIKPTVDVINENGALYGKNIVFTGELSIDRNEARQIAVNAGAIIKSGISRKVDYLVVGVQDKAIVGEDGLSSKEEKAYELNEAGAANIVFLNEEQFLELAKSEVNV